jgi:erythromycin esterase-like protein
MWTKTRSQDSNTADAQQASALAAVKAAAKPLNTPTDLQPLIDMIGDAKVVLIGEASHGTHEFYQMRAQISRFLIEQKGFNGIAVEADWHSASSINDYVRGAGDANTPEAALQNFDRFPSWMWRNTDVRDFIRWLRDYNEQIEPEEIRIGFYGLDVYGMFGSIADVIEGLETIDPEAAERARDRYRCFQGFDENPQVYGYVAASDQERSCHLPATEQLMELVENPPHTPLEELALSLEQNARVVLNSEAVYRAMFEGQVSTWNLRDEHMAETVDALMTHLERQSGTAKLIIWAHNSHVGNAQATSMGARGEFNIGQLMRERYGDDAVLVGFSTYGGSVMAAHDWGEDPVVMRINPGMPGSYEALFHQVDMSAFLLMLRDDEITATQLQDARLQRAIGVIYRPQTERFSHYFEVMLPDQFDAIMHIDQTTPVEPLS